MQLRSRAPALEPPPARATIERVRRVRRGSGHVGRFTAKGGQRDMQFDLFSSPIRFATFDDLLAAMYALGDDPLAGFGTRMVIYRGSPAARLMVVGEAPGAEEDAQGLPFV